MVGFKPVTSPPMHPGHGKVYAFALCTSFFYVFEGHFMSPLGFFWLKIPLQLIFAQKLHFPDCQSLPSFFSKSLIGPTCFDICTRQHTAQQPKAPQGIRLQVDCLQDMQPRTMLSFCFLHQHRLLCLVSRQRHRSMALLQTFTGSAAGRELCRDSAGLADQGRGWLSI